MVLSSKSPSQVTEDDLLLLILNKEPEAKQLEYKRGSVGRSDNDKKEFLYDVTSLANSEGGYLLFGVSASNGIPTALPGLGDIDYDAEVLRMEEMLRDGVKPAIAGVETGSVSLAAGGYVIVVKVPRSWISPHQVTFQKVFRFYARGSNGKYQIDVDDLRSIFAVSASIAERFRDFRAERTARIALGDTPATLSSGGVLVLHVVPFSAFNIGGTFPLAAVSQSASSFPPLGSGSVFQYQVTFDGLVITSNANPPPVPQRAYTQVLRTGAVEAVASSITRGRGDLLILQFLSALIVKYAGVYIRALDKFGAEPPFAALVSLINVKGMRLLEDIPEGAVSEDIKGPLLTRNQFHFVETVFNKLPASSKAVGTALRGTLDHMANTAGLPSSPYFDAAGEYTQ